MTARQETTPGVGEGSLLKRVDALEGTITETANVLEARLAAVTSGYVDFLRVQGLRLEADVEGTRYKQPLGHEFVTDDGTKLVVFPASTHPFPESDRMSITVFPPVESEQPIAQIIIVSDMTDIMTPPFHFDGGSKERHPLLIGYYPQTEGSHPDEPLWHRLDGYNPDAYGLVAPHSRNFLGVRNTTSVTLPDQEIYIARHSDPAKRVDPVVKAEEVLEQLKNASYMGAYTQESQLISPL